MSVDRSADWFLLQQRARELFGEDVEFFGLINLTPDKQTGEGRFTHGGNMPFDDVAFFMMMLINGQGNDYLEMFVKHLRSINDDIKAHTNTG